MIHMPCDFQRGDSEFNGNIALEFPAPVAVIEQLHGFGKDGKAVIVQPVDERARRLVFLVRRNGGVIVRTQQRTARTEFSQQALEVDIEAQGLRRMMKIFAINKEYELFE